MAASYVIAFRCSHTPGTRSKSSKACCYCLLFSQALMAAPGDRGTVSTAKGPATSPAAAPGTVQPSRRQARALAGLQGAHHCCRNVAGADQDRGEQGGASQAYAEVRCPQKTAPHPMSFPPRAQVQARCQRQIPWLWPDGRGFKKEETTRCQPKPGT